MPIVNVNVDWDAREEYLNTYKARAVALLDAHVKAYWDVFITNKPWLEMAFQHRAIQAFAYLSDPNGDANIARYPLIDFGIPSYGTTRTEVAEGYISYNNSISNDIVYLYEDHRQAVEAIPLQPDKPQIDYVVQTFIDTHAIPS